MNIQFLVRAIQYNRVQIIIWLPKIESGLLHTSLLQNMCVVFCWLSFPQLENGDKKAYLIELLWGLTKVRFNTHRAYWVYTILIRFSCLLQRCRITVLFVGCPLGLLDLSSPTRDWTQAGYSHWVTESQIQLSDWAHTHSRESTKS